MNYQQLEKNLWTRVQLQPVPCRLDENGLELPTIDGDWIIDRITDDGVHVSGIETQYATTPGYDHIHHFTSNRERDRAGLKYGFLTLSIQIYLQGNDLRIRPTIRPGEKLPPPIVDVLEKTVDFNYPTDSGLQDRLKANGYRIAWCREPDVARWIELDGWGFVLERDTRGSLASYRLKDWPHDQILLRRIF